MPEPSAIPPRPSSTVLLLRESPEGFEVFMVQRHHQVDFAKGALVFPGGKVDRADSDPALRPRCGDADGFDDDALALRVAAVRETFEETGLLLARRPGQPELLRDADVGPIESRHRESLLANDTTIRAIAEDEDLELACDQLVPFAHWITPERAPKRFDTHFFVVAAPTDQVGAHDGSESVDSLWITPHAAVAEGDAGRRTVVFPTRLNLEKLARASNVSDALERARRTPIVTVLPTLERTPDGPMIRIPAEADYGLTLAPLGPDF